MRKNVSSARLSPSWERLRFSTLSLAAGWLAPLVLPGYFTSLRTRVLHADRPEALRQAGRSIIFILWHEHLLLPLYLHRGQGITVLVSQHRDGELVSRLLHRLGYRTVRGSSTRGGGAAYRRLLNLLLSGRAEVAITPDGPLGPRRRAHAGAGRLALESGAAIVPISVVGSRVRRLNSWDRFLLPLPASRVVINYGQPLCWEPAPPREVLTRRLAELQAALQAAEQEALAWLHG